MIPKYFSRFALINLFFFAIHPSPLIAQSNDCDARTLEEFFECYGGENAFSAHSINAVTTFIQAEDAINAGEFQKAKTLLDNLLRAYPTGNNAWWNVFWP